jgi:putative hydrolase of the HAD superfamily
MTTLFSGSRCLPALDPQAVKAVVFDIDGVILKAQDEQGKYLWSRTIKADLGLGSAHLRAIFDVKWADIIRGKADLNSHLTQVFQQDIFKNLSITPEQYISYWLNHDQNICQDMMTVAAHITVPCYLASNQEAVRAAHLKKLLEIPVQTKDFQASPLANRLFAGAFFSCDIGFAKPEPNFFRHIERALGLCPENIFFIDDMPDYIAGAKACGWHTCLYSNDRGSLVDRLTRYGVFA